MKLLTTLRELRIENAIIAFDDYHFSMCHYHDGNFGIGNISSVDIMRLNQESNILEFNNLDAHHYKQK